MRRNLQRAAIIDELKKFGVAWRDQGGGKHAKIAFNTPGGMRFIPYSRGGGARDGAITRIIRSQIRRTLRQHQRSLS
jgi:hypothetical protein